MFLFDRPYQYFEEPWPHIIIENVLPEDAAERMLNNWPDNLPPRGLGDPAYYEDKWFSDHKDQVFDDFEQVNFIDRADDVLKALAEAFNEPVFDDCDIDGLMYRDDKFSNLPAKQKTAQDLIGKIENVISETGEIIGQKKIMRGWHLDNPNKKYHGMLYIGSGENSEFVAGNEKTGIDKTYEYRHNRLIMWRNTPDTLHKFYCGVESRKTISIACNYKLGYSQPWPNK